MRNLISTRALRAFAAVAALSLVATACSDDPIAPDPEPETAQIVLTIGTPGANPQVVLWTTANGSVSPTNVTIPAGQTRAVTAAFFRADGTVDPVVTDSDFRLDFTATGGTGVTVTKTGNLSATITGSGTAGQSVTYTISLFHLEEGHEEYETSAGAFRVTVQ
jgi:hypothetical protein